MSTFNTTSCSVPNRPRQEHGFALLLTVVVLVVLTTVGYTLCARLAELKRRQQYMIDYQKSRYACDSAMKYALGMMGRVNITLIPREDEPDFSDLFIMNQQEYEDLLSQWAQIKTEKAAQEMAASATDTYDPADAYVDANTLIVPGPYGPEWPLIQEPMEFQIGDSMITITIEDENARMPLTWVATTSSEINRQAMAAVQNFCEWMQMTPSEIEQLIAETDRIAEYKQFSISMTPVTYTEKTQVMTSPLRNVRSSPTVRPTTSTRIVKKTRPAIAHATDFAMLLHSSLIDTEKLAWAIPETGDRYESPLKYLALWGSQRVNINSAPRHVLEAAFAFGGDAREIADEIIQFRRVEPFKSVDQLKEKLYGYNDSIRKAEPYICTTSKFLSVRVVASTGAAKVSSVATVIREGTNAQRIAILTN